MGFDNYEQDLQEHTNYGGDDGSFWSAEKGENKVRILTDYVAHGVHWGAGAQGTICIGKDEGCEYCEKGDNPNGKFMLWLYDRGKDAVQIAQLGPAIVNEIGKLKDSDDWGFEEKPDYDIIIHRKGEGLDTEYGVMPTKNDDELPEEVQERFENEYTPPEDIIERMKDKVKGNNGDEEKTAENEAEEIDVDDIPV